MSLTVFRDRPALGRTAAVLVAVLSSLVLAPGTASAASVPAAVDASHALAPVEQAPPADQENTFGIGPATAGHLDGRPVLSYNVSPGAVYPDEVGVVNLSDKPLSLLLYTTDATNGVDGGLSYRPRADPGTGAHTWVTLEAPGNTGSVTVPARSDVFVPITVRVPQDAGPGDHLVGIRVALTAKAETTNDKQFTFEQGVTLQTRFRVSGDIRAALSVERMDADYHDEWNPTGSGDTTVTYTVHNTGNVTLGAAQRLTVSNLFGEHGPTTEPAPVPVLLPGSSYSVRVTVPGTFPLGVLTARVQLTPTPLQLLPGVRLGVFEGTAATLTVPWSLLASLLLLAGLVLIARHRNAPAAPRHQRQLTGTGGRV